MKRPLLHISLPFVSGLSLALALLWLLGGGLPTVRAANFDVTNTDDGGPGSLRQAIADANAHAGHDTITIAITVTGKISLSSSLDITESATITGPGAAQLAVDGNHTSRVFNITSGDVSISGLTIQNGSVGYTYGGGIYAGGSLTLTDVIVISNTANGYGGGAYVKGNAVLSGGRFENNMAGGHGGGVQVNGDLTLRDVEFISNTAGEGGGAHVEGNVTLSGGRFERNSCTTTVCLGGGLHVWQGLFMTGTHFIGNKALSDGSDGGGAFVYGMAELSSGRFENNTSYHCGGLLASILTMTDTQFISNTATYHAGGACVMTATLTGGRFENNSSGTSAGGGLYVDRVLALTGTQFIRNWSAGDGGGLYAYGNTTTDVRMVNALFAGNSADGNGAALYLFDPGNATILHTTITSPSLVSDAAIYVAAGTVQITNTLIASYTTGISNTGGAVYEDYNLFFGNTITSAGTITHGGHSFTGDPAFANPAAGDYHLTAVSSAIDRGVDAGVYTDLDGRVRPWPSGGSFDIGAYEYAPPPYCFAQLMSSSTVYSSTGASAAQQAVDAASVGDTVKVAGACAGVQQREGISQTVYISKSLTLRGGYTTTDWTTSNPTAYPTVLDAKGLGRVIFITGTAGNVENLIVQNGVITGSDFWCPDAGCGGGIYAASDLTLTNVTVLSNTAKVGGAYAEGAVQLSGGLFQNNQDGGLVAQSTLALTGTEFISNAARIGGGVYVRGTAKLVAGRFENNVAKSYGGGAYVNGSLALTDTQFISNIAFEAGGAWVKGDVTLMGGRFERNSCTAFMCLGGGLHVERTLIMTGAEFISNEAEGSGSDGGGAFVLGAAELVGGRFESNSSGHCGGLCATNSLTLTGTEFISNTANDNGGGALATTATLIGGRFENNHCTNTDCTGGGMAVGNITLTGTRFISNTATGYGGGVYVAGYDGGDNRIVNALFAGNSADGNGAALYLFPNYAGGNAAILHTTIASPTLGSGAAIYVATGTVQITNTLIASYTTAISNTGGMVYEDYNLFFGNTITSAGTITHGGHSFTGDPAFASLADDDYHLTAASLAIERGADVGVLTDFESETRPQGLAPDIGYDESPYTIQANLTIGKASTLSLAGPEAAITYTVVVTNHGPQPAANVRLTDMVPVSTTFRSIVCPSGWSCVTPPVSGAGDITATIPSLAAGVPSTFTIVVKIDSAASHGALITNTAAIASDTFDPIAGAPNIASVTTHVRWHMIYLPLAMRNGP